MIHRIILYILSALNYLISKDSNKYIFMSYPDFSDNSLAVFVNLCEKEMNSTIKKRKFVWITKGVGKLIPKSIEELTKKVNCKVANKASLKGIFHFLTSKYVFYTHSNYDISIPKRQIVINLWHGMPLKTLGLSAGKKLSTSFTYVLATSEMFGDIMCNKVFGVNVDKVLICGLPRNDFMKISNFDFTRFKINNYGYKKIVLWMPTFRVPNSENQRNEYIQGDINSTGLPLVDSDKLGDLNNLLNKLNILLLIKTHPIDKGITEENKMFSNVHYLDNQIFLENGYSIYSCLPCTDALITDYSSVYMDFLLLDKPIGFVIDDIVKYRKERGFIIEPAEEWMPGKKIVSYKELMEFIIDLECENDLYKENRRYVNNKINYYKGINFTDKLLRLIKES